jgi:NADP-dependent 3-hydroxy acid dehydrogenase YdfG
MRLSKNLLIEGVDKNIGVTVINQSHVKTPMTETIDHGVYGGDVPACLEGWLDQTDMQEGVHAACIDVGNVAEAALWVATRTPDVAVPQIGLYPISKVHRYGMDV